MSERDPKKIHPTLGSKLAYWREERGFSLRKLADEAEVSHGLIGQIERGETNAGYETACKLAKALRIPVQYLWDLDPGPSGH